MPRYLLVFSIAANAVLGQLLLKRALLGLGGATALANWQKFVIDALKSPWIYGSLAIQALGYLLWMVLISKSKLGTATASVGGSFYVMLALCAWIVFGETMSLLQWLGIVLVSLGVACIGVSGG